MSMIFLPQREKHFHGEDTSFVASIQDLREEERNVLCR